MVKNKLVTFYDKRYNKEKNNSNQLSCKFLIGALLLKLKCTCCCAMSCMYFYGKLSEKYLIKQKLVFFLSPTPYLSDLCYTLLDFLALTFKISKSFHSMSCELALCASFLLTLSMAFITFSHFKDRLLFSLYLIV